MGDTLHSEKRVGNVAATPRTKRRMPDSWVDNEGIEAASRAREDDGLAGAVAGALIVAAIPSIVGDLLPTIAEAPVDGVRIDDADVVADPEAAQVDDDGADAEED